VSGGFQIIDGVPHIGAKAYPWAVKVRCNDHPDAKYTYRARGFWLLFKNGWTLSIQFGAGNYCANRDAGWGDQRVEWLEECPDAELAAWWGEGANLIDWPGGDNVIGWQSAEDVLRWIEDFSARPSRERVS
jgi:hypothetical protein